MLYRVLIIFCLACSHVYGKTVEETRALLAALQPGDMISFGPQNAARQIYIFTDLACVYCRHQHKEVPALISSGVRVNYLAYPRTGYSSTSGKEITAVFCAEDQQSALTNAKLGIAPDRASTECENPVRKTLKLGDALRLPGTPSIYTDAGVEIGGYRKAKQILQHLRMRYVKPSSDIEALAQ